MDKDKIKIGDRFGKLRVCRIEKEKKDSTYLRIVCKCIECGAWTTRTDTTIFYPDRQDCRKCGKTKRMYHKRPQKKTKNKKTKEANRFKPVAEPLNREFTPDTEWLICLYHSEGETCSDIAKILKRDVRVIEETVERCKANGRYEQHAKRSIKHCGVINVTGFHGNRTRKGTMPNNNRIKARVAKVNKIYI